MFKKFSRPILFGIVVAMGIAWHPPIARAQPGPVVEYSSLLEAFDVRHHNGLLTLHRDHPIVAAWLPNGAKVEVAITRSGSATPIYRQPLEMSAGYGVFSRLTGYHANEFYFTQAGAYEVTFLCNGAPMTRLPFSVFVKSDGDDFNPRKFFYVQGEWDDWGFLHMPLDESDPAQVWCWARVVSMTETPGAVRYTAEIRKDGDVIADCGDAFTSSHEWQQFKFSMKYPENKGGAYMKSTELLERGDGTYHIVMKHDNKMHRVWKFEVVDGKPVRHARQASDHSPRTSYMIPRHAGIYDAGESAGNIVWMKRLPDSEARAVYAKKSAEVEGPSAEQRNRWQWLPSADHRRPFNLVVTDIETRSDTTIRAGDDIIVFGTGYPTGVKYIQVGDSEPREIPDGETYNAMVFAICGKKIVLVKRNSVHVFDSATGKVSKIPDDVIHLYDPKGGLHRPNHLIADGNLVATVNAATKVTDRTIIKVIDVSGDEPKIIPIKNADYADREVSCVALNSKDGILAASSRAKKSLYLAKVARLANQHSLNVADYRGVNDNQIYLSNDKLIYVDEDDRLRYLDPGSPPIALTDQTLGSTGNGFVARKGRVVIATAEHYGDRYHMAMSDLPDKPIVLEGTAEPIKGTSGGLGMAGSAAITHEKTVFLSGTSHGGIGVGEHLQILDKESRIWLPVVHPDGKVVTAIDATASIGLVAFKTKDTPGQKTTVAYLTFGDRIDLAQVPTQRERNEQVASQANADGPKPAGKMNEVESPYYTKNQQELDLIVGYVTTDKETGDALAQAFGEEEGRKKARQAILDVMKKNGHEHLIPSFLKMLGGSEESELGEQKKAPSLDESGSKTHSKSIGDESGRP